VPRALPAGEGERARGTCREEESSPAAWGVAREGSGEWALRGISREIVISADDQRGDETQNEPEIAASTAMTRDIKGIISKGAPEEGCS